MNYDHCRGLSFQVSHVVFLKIIMTIFKFQKRNFMSTLFHRVFQLYSCRSTSFETQASKCTLLTHLDSAVSCLRNAMTKEPLQTGYSSSIPMCKYKLMVFRNYHTHLSCDALMKNYLVWFSSQKEFLSEGVSARIAPQGPFLMLNKKKE